MELKEEALQTQYNRDLEKIYKEYPELRKNNVSLSNIFKGLFSSIVDVASINSIPLLHDCFLKENSKENELKYKQCMEEINMLHNKYKENKKMLIEEHSNRLISLNKEDKEEIDRYKQENEIKPLQNINENEIISHIYNILGVLNSYKEISNISKKMNPENAILTSLEHFNYKNIGNISNEVMTLILDNNIDEDVKLNNINYFLTNMAKLKDTGKDITKYQDVIAPLIVASDCFKKHQDLVDRIKENYKQNIEQCIEPRYIHKINMAQNIPVYLSC